MAETPKRDWSQFTCRIAIKASPARVFRAWTDDKLVSRWFTEKTVIEPKKNGRIYFEWTAGDTFETTVTSIVKNRKFVFPFDAEGTMVEVKFKKDGRGCVCELRQYNMKTSPEMKWNMHRGCITGWTFFMTNLKAYLEHGIDLRGHDPKKSYKQNYVNS
ncbi:MAG: SRPBCC domain-containing protein [candidate division Zixibacteria bacterium]|nr:SRPBCC domain-containing protein [candidate division Zixibacteria bacterium]